MKKALAVSLLIPFLAAGGQNVLIGHNRQVGSMSCAAPSMEHLYKANSLVCSGGCTGGATVTAWNDIGTAGGLPFMTTGTPTYTTNAVNGVPGVNQTGTTFFSNIAGQYTTGLPVTYYVVSKFAASTSGAWVGGGNGQLEVRYSTTSTTLFVQLLNEQNASLATVTYTGLTNGQGTIIAWQYNTTTHDVSIWRCLGGTCTLGASGNGVIPLAPTDFGGAFADGLFFQGDISEGGWVTSGNPLAAIGTYGQCKYGI